MGKRQRKIWACTKLVRDFCAALIIYQTVGSTSIEKMADQKCSDLE